MSTKKLAGKGKLTERQAKFVREFLTDFNGTQAAIRAGYSKKSASEESTRLLRDARINEAIQAQQEQLRYKADKYEVTPERVVREFAKVGFADMGDFATWGPDGVTLVDSGRLSRDQTSVVGEVTETRTYFGESGEKVVTKIKLADKLKALENLGKYLGLFKEQVSLVGQFELVLPEEEEGEEEEGTIIDGEGYIEETESEHTLGPGTGGQDQGDGEEDFMDW